MGMQIASMSTRPGVPLASPQEFQREKRVSLSPEQKPEASRAEAPLSDGRPADLQQTVSDLEQMSSAFGRRLRFVIDQESREITVKVIDRETDKVIKVLPPEELQRLDPKLRETLGFLFDKTV